MWHVPYTARHLLYQGGISGETNKQLFEGLSNIVFDPTTSPAEQDNRLKKWIRQHQSEAPQTTRHVELARDGLRNIQEHPALFDVVTTSPMERQVVEVNKRFENGGGWTEEGAEALLGHVPFLVD